MKNIIKSTKKTKAKSAKRTITNRQSKNAKSLVPITKSAKKTGKKVGIKTEKPSPKYYLTDLSKCRKALNNLLNTFNEVPDSNISRVRTKVFLINSVISCFQIEKEIAIEERLDRLEENNGMKIFSDNKEALL